MCQIYKAVILDYTEPSISPRIRSGREIEGSMDTHMCQFFIGKRRGVCSSICVEFLSRNDAAYIAPYVSNFISR
ncbi:MAG TPA: hypothetical protein PLI57_00035 [Spirochaetota bacterium]|nr:hypothetical protein [Spirochaetota bacterium]